MVQQRGHGLAHDIWQIGVLLYHMLVGRSPFEAAIVDSSIPDVYIHMRDHDNESFLALRRRIINGSVAYPWEIGVKASAACRGSS